MNSRFFYSYPSKLVIGLVLLLILGGCVPASPVPVDQSTQPGTVATNPPFNPTVPSVLEETTMPTQTPAQETSPGTPASCTVEGMQTYTNSASGYCFAYPSEGFTLNNSGEGLQDLVVSGPPLDDTAEPVQATLTVSSQPVPAVSDLPRLVDQFLSQSPYRSLASEIVRSQVSIGNEPAEVLDHVPGRLSSRLLMAVHGEMFYTLTFSPTDIDLADADLTRLYEAVTSSYGFFDPAEPRPASLLREVSYPEFGHVVSLAYDPALALWTEAGTIEAIPVSPEVLWAESHPTYMQVNFYGYNGGKAYQLPLLPLENRFANVSVFQTSDFTDFGGDFPGNYSDQHQALASILDSGLEPGFCDRPLVGDSEPRSLPFLPLINTLQTFCAYPEEIQFSGGRGIRYVTYYSSGLSPVLDPQVFYTFQGLTDDGQFYVSAAFPIATGIFPTESPTQVITEEMDFVQVWIDTMTEQLNQLNASSTDSIRPSLETLDALIASIRIE